MRSAAEPIEGHYDLVDDSTYGNVDPTARWVAWFAEREFLRAASADTSFLTRWAVLLKRRDPSRRALLEEAESLLAPPMVEVADERTALLEAVPLPAARHEPGVTSQCGGENGQDGGAGRRARSTSLLQRVRPAVRPVRTTAR